MSLNAGNHYSDNMGTASLWVGFGFSIFATVVFMGISAMSDKPKQAIFHNLATVIVAITALAYLIEALGNTEMFTVRPLLWIRYAQWVTNGPLVLALAGLLAGTTVVELAFVSGLHTILVASLFAAAISSGYNATWPIFVFGVVASLPIYYTVLVTWMGRASTLSKSVRGLYMFVAYFGAILGLGYTVNWGTAEGGKVQSLDQEIITYTVLDILYRVVIPFVVVFSPALDHAGGVISEAAVEKAEEASETRPHAV